MREGIVKRGMIWKYIRLFLFVIRMDFLLFRSMQLILTDQRKWLDRYCSLSSLPQAPPGAIIVRPFQGHGDLSNQLQFQQRW